MLVHLIVRPMLTTLDSRRHGMPGILRIMAGGLVLLSVGCQSKADVAAATRDLLRTDRAWATLAAANGPVDSLVGYWTSDARVILAGQPVLVGTDAIRQMVAATRAIPGFRISWTPDSAVVSRSGDFGYTYGTNRITAPDSTGTLHTAEGRYITVWRKEPDGRWRCSVDISNEGPAASKTPSPEPR
jgi:ketosteroid isomerase-like protein